MKLIVLMTFALCAIIDASAQQIGDLDTSFNATGKVITDFNSGGDGGTGVIIQPDGKIIAVGYTSVGNNYSYALSRYNSNGTLDTSFGGTGKVITDFAPGYDYASSIALQTDGKIVAAGNKWTGNHGDNSLVRYNTNGSLDTSFGNGGKVETPIGVGDAGISAMKIQPDGKIVAAGICTNSSFGRDFAITRYNSDGSLDISFGSAGIVMFDFATSSDFPFALALQADGKIIAGGATGQDPIFDFGLVRLDTLGNVDNTFGINGTVTTDFGKPDEWGNAMTIQPDGKILICGNSGSPYKIAMARYNDDGSLDTTFNVTGKVLTGLTTHDDANAIALQADGKIIVSGVSWNGSNRDFSIIRYTTDGLLDTTFSSNGFTTTDFGTNTDKATGVAVQADGKIVATGNAGTDLAVARYIVSLSTGIIDFVSMNNAVLIYPNPVSQNATMVYTLSQPESISIRLFDVTGRLVSVILENQLRSASEHQQIISFPDDLAHGTYYVVISNATQRVSVQVVK